MEAECAPVEPRDPRVGMDCIRALPRPRSSRAESPVPVACAVICSCRVRPRLSGKLMSESLDFKALRRAMVDAIVAHARAAGPDTGRAELARAVLDVMARVPRHEFVPTELRAFAYFDTPLPIGFGKTISQPYIVALMTDLLDIRPSDRVLDVGTGLGYQAAVLARLASRVYTIEIIEELARSAARRLAEQGCDNVEVKVGDGSGGWAGQAPFDRILVAAAPELIPPALLAQLASDGRMVIPAGLDGAQTLMLVTRNESGGLATEDILSVRFSELVLPD